MRQVSVRWSPQAGFLALVLVLAGCLVTTAVVAQEDPSGADEVPDQQGPSDSSGLEIDDGGAGVVIPPEAQSVADLALADAARRTGLDPSAITVVTLEAVDWPDGSLGCPQPGMAYTQMVMPGYRLVLDAQGTQLEYHTDLLLRAVTCDQPGRGVSASS